MYRARRTQTDDHTHMHHTLRCAAVLILLHGNGGSGAISLAGHIVVKPEGRGGSWNIKGEESTDDDAGFIGSTLVNYMANQPKAARWPDGHSIPCL